MAKNTLPILSTILSQVLLFSLVDCFAGDYNTSPKIRINYLSQNSGKHTFLNITYEISQRNSNNAISKN